MTDTASLLRNFLNRLRVVVAGLMVAALIGEIAWLIWVGPILPEPQKTALVLPTPLPPPAPLPEPLPAPEPPVEKKSAMPAADVARLNRMLAAASSMTPVKERKKIRAESVPAAVTAMQSLATFRDCAQCPLMVLLPTGRFNMGSTGGNTWEMPRHSVGINQRVALARFEISERQWQACVEDTYCDRKAGNSTLPVVKISWQDTRDYVDWLSDKTGRRYRLPSEAEWAYAIRGGSNAARYWGQDRREQCLYANGADESLRKTRKLKTRFAKCDDRYARRAPAGSFKPNAFGLHDMAGNVWEWVQDCWADNYQNAPADGSAVTRERCPAYVIRGGSWRSEPEALRSAERARALPGQRSDDLGFRVAAD